MHFLLQDPTEQASFSWHDDSADLGNEGDNVHMTSVIVSLSQQVSGMRVWGFEPHVYSGVGSGSVFAGAALHESVRMKGVVTPVRKVALFFA